MYLLNGGFGSVFLVVGAVLAAVKGRWLLELLGQIPQLLRWMPIVGCAAICLLAAMNIITAPSISLEGKSIWLLQSLPVSGWQVLRSKLRLHMLITAAPALLCSVVLNLVLLPDPLSAVLLLVTPAVFSFLCAVLGLTVNLLMPRLDWVSEAHAVKQSGSSMLAIFADWGIVLVFAALFFALRNAVSPAVFLLICTAVMALACWSLCRWLKTRGAAIFGAL